MQSEGIQTPEKRNLGFGLILPFNNSRLIGEASRGPVNMCCGYIYDVTVLIYLHQHYSRLRLWYIFGF